MPAFGALPDGYTIDTLLGDHASKPRSKNIAAVFYRAGFIESWGRGIRKVFDECARHGEGLRRDNVE